MPPRARRGTLLQELALANPWWRSPGWRSADPDLSAAARAPFDRAPSVLADITPPNLYTLRGPRRAGKTTVLKQTVARLCDSGIDPRRICFYAADRIASSTDLINLFQAAHQLFPDLADQPRFFLIDEISSVPEWPRAVKWLRDNTALGQDCIVLSGSSARDVASGTEHLAGRRGPDSGLDRLLLPFSFPEFLRCAGYVLPQAPRLSLPDFYTPAGRRACSEAVVYLDILVSAFEAYLVIGGFPQAVAGFRITGSVPDGFARDLWDVVQSDLRAAGMTRPEQALRLLERVCASLSSRIGFREVGEALGVAHSTVGDWLSALAESYVLFHLYQEANGLPAIDRQRKIYPTDPFIAQLPSRLAIGQFAPDLSQLAEATLAVCLHRGLVGNRLDRFDAPARLFYYRTSGGGEVDFIVPPGPMALESKYVDVASERESRAMTSNFERGLLLTRTAFGESSRVSAIPASVFAWLLYQGD